MGKGALIAACVAAILALAYGVERVGGPIWVFVFCVAAIVSYVGGSAAWDVWGRGRGGA